MGRGSSKAGRSSGGNSAGGFTGIQRAARTSTSGGLNAAEKKAAEANVKQEGEDRYSYWDSYGDKIIMVAHSKAEAHREYIKAMKRQNRYFT